MADKIDGPITLLVTLRGTTDLGSQIYRQLRDAVVEGRLRHGERLPPTRDLARRLAVSRNTVAGAYDRLVAEGFCDGQVGAGPFVRADPAGPRTGRVRRPGSSGRGRSGGTSSRRPPRPRSPRPRTTSGSAFPTAGCSRQRPGAACSTASCAPRG